MGYQTGTASSAIDMMDKIRIVAESQGWITDYNADVIAATTRFLSLRKGAVNFNFLSDISAGNPTNLGGFVYMNLAVGFNAASSFANQPLNSYTVNEDYYNTITNALTGATTSYHIFYDTDYVHTVIETQPGIYSYICFGILDKYGTYTGGEYIAGSNWQYSTNVVNSPEANHTYLFDNDSKNSNYGGGHTIRVEVDGKRYFYNNIYIAAGKYCTGIIKLAANRATYSVTEVPNSKEFLATPNIFNQVTPLLNTPIYIERGNNLHSPIGEVKGLRTINMKNYNHKDIITLGADNWMVFPAKKKTLVRDSTTGDTTPNSWLFGYAFKKF